MTAAIVCLLVAPIFGEPLSQGERDRAMSALHATRKLFLDSIAGLTDAQWKFKPDDKTWSIAECAEHIAISEDTIFERTTQKLMATPPATDEAKAATKGKDEGLMEAVVDRSTKFQAPEVLRPAKRWPTREALIEHFKQSRDRTIAYIQTTNDDLRSHIAPHPVAGPLDAYQWILLIAAHSERHTLQINEVKQNPQFPKE